jgi:hypothetical protein
MILHLWPLGVYFLLVLALAGVILSVTRCSVGVTLGITRFGRAVISAGFVLWTDYPNFASSMVNSKMDPVAQSDRAPSF